MGCSFGKAQDSVLKKRSATSCNMAPSARNRQNADGGMQRSRKGRSSVSSATVNPRDGYAFRPFASCSETDVGRWTGGMAAANGGVPDRHPADPWELRSGASGAGSSKHRSVSAMDFRTVTSVCGNSTLRISLSDDGMMLVVEKANVDGTSDVEEEDGEQDDGELPAAAAAAAADDNVFLATAIIEDHHHHNHLHQQHSYHQQYSVADEELARAASMAEVRQRNFSTDAEPEEWQSLQRHHQRRLPHGYEGISPASALSDDVYESLRPRDISTQQTQRTERDSTEQQEELDYGCIWQNSCNDQQPPRAQQLFNNYPVMEEQRCTCTCRCGADTRGPAAGMRVTAIHGSLLDFHCGQGDESHSYDEIPQLFYDDDLYTDSESSASLSRVDVSQYSRQQTMPSNRVQQHPVDQYEHNDVIWPIDDVGKKFLPQLTPGKYGRGRALITAKRGMKEEGGKQGTPVSGIISYCPTWDGGNDSECAGSSNASTPYVVFIPRQPQSAAQ